MVRVDLNTYKIHLGSGNVLISPDDIHLRTLSRQTKQPPFEGDHTMTAILSKALLLAADTKTTDESIREDT